MNRDTLIQARTLVIKVGSSLLASVQGGLDTAFIARLAGQLAALAAQNRRIVLVSSGAVAAGTAELGFTVRPKKLSNIQAAAAAGQGALMEIYRNLLSYYHITAAQVLLTRDCLHNRQRFLYARNVLLALLKRGALPIINENDVIAVEELHLKMGDNDFLAVSTAQLVDADAIIILSDVDGLYTKPPSEPDAKLIHTVTDISNEVMSMAGGSVSGVGTGGMTSKLNAARAANLANVPLLVAGGRNPDILLRIMEGEEEGTIFVPPGKRESAYRQWIAFGRRPDGSIVVDDNACSALVDAQRSLLPIGITEVRGTFEVGDTVVVMDARGHEIARGLTNFTSQDLLLIKGHKSYEFSDILGHHCEETALHKDNLVITAGRRQDPQPQE